MERDYGLIPEGECVDDGRLSPIILVVNKLERIVVEAIQGPYAELIDDPETSEVYNKVHDAVWDRYPYDPQSGIDLVYINMHAEDDVKRKLITMFPQYLNWNEVEITDFRKISTPGVD